MFESQHPRDKFGKFVKKINEKGFDAKIEDFADGDPNNKNSLGLPDRNPYVKDGVAYLYDENNYIAAFHEWGHLYTHKNPQKLREYSEKIGDYDEYLDATQGRYREVVVQDIGELFAEAFAHYINDETDNEIEILKTILKKETNNGRN